MADVDALPREEVANNNPKKKGRGRRALKDISTSDVNISAGKTSSGINKGKGEGLAVVLSPKRSKALSKSKPAVISAAAVAPVSSFADDLEELQARLDQLRLEKEKTDELLKERDEMLKQKEEELESRGKEQERLQKELRKLQKLKEFKPTVVSFSNLMFCDGLFYTWTSLPRSFVSSFLACRAFLCSSLLERRNKERRKQRRRTKILQRGKSLVQPTCSGAKTSGRRYI